MGDLTHFLEVPTPKGKRVIGVGHPAFIIGEISGNHNADFDRALRLIDIAVAAGVDAVKIQTYTADTLTIDCHNDYFKVQVNEAWAGETLYSLYNKAYTPWDWQPKLMKYAADRGLLLFSTPFDESSVDFLEEMGMNLYKVASFESTHIPLLRRIGRTKKPVILSRGLTSIDDLELAIETLRTSGCPSVAVLHCVSAYPASPQQMNLRTITDLATRFNVVAGLSDHSMGLIAPITAVAMGASIIEKHFTIARADGGPDGSFSLEGDELRELVIGVRTAEACLGKVTYEGDVKEKENVVFRRSVFAVESIDPGQSITTANIRIIRPGYGLAPKHFDNLIGKVATRRIERGTPMSWDLVK